MLWKILLNTVLFMTTNSDLSPCVLFPFPKTFLSRYPTPTDFRIDSTFR